MSLGVLLVHEVAVVCTYQFDVVFACQFDDNLVRFLLQRVCLAVRADGRVLHFMPLQLEVIVVSEDAFVPQQRLFGTLDVAFQDFCRNLSGYTCRADDEPLVVFLEVFVVGTGTHVEAVHPCPAHQFDEVFVSGIVLGEHHEVMSALVALLFYLIEFTSPCHVHLASQDGLERRFACFFQFGVLLFAVVEKLFYAHHVSVIGHCHAPHAVVHGFVYKLLDACLSVKNTIIGVYVEVNKFLHKYYMS